MNTTRGDPTLVFVATVAGVMILSSTGCVSSSKYEEMKKEAEQTQRDLRQERQKMLEVEKVHAERKKLVDEWLSKLGHEVKRLNIIATTCSDLQNELTLLRIARELQRGKSTGISLVIEGQPSTPEPGQSMESQPGAAQSQSKELLKDLSQQLRRLFEEQDSQKQ
jgi:hypothetical protein